VEKFKKYINYDIIIFEYKIFNVRKKNDGKRKSRHDKKNRLCIVKIIKLL